MQFKSPGGLRQGFRPIDMVPLVHVVFLVMVFVMLTLSFTMPPGITVILPRVLAGGAVLSEHIELMITHQGVVFFDGKPASAQQLANLLRQAAGREQAVLIKADMRAPLNRVVDVWDLCRDSGIRRISLAANQ